MKTPTESEAMSETISIPCRKEQLPAAFGDQEQVRAAGKTRQRFQQFNGTYQRFGFALGLNQSFQNPKLREGHES